MGRAQIMGIKRQSKVGYWAVLGAERTDDARGSNGSCHLKCIRRLVLVEWCPLDRDERVDRNRLRVCFHGSELRQQADAIFFGFAQPKDAATADRYASLRVRATPRSDLGGRRGEGREGVRSGAEGGEARVVASEVGQQFDAGCIGDGR